MLKPCLHPASHKLIPATVAVHRLSLLDSLTASGAFNVLLGCTASKAHFPCACIPFCPAFLGHIRAKFFALPLE